MKVYCGNKSCRRQLGTVEQVGDSSVLTTWEGERIVLEPGSVSFVQCRRRHSTVVAAESLNGRRSQVTSAVIGPEEPGPAV